jgi:Zn-dependent alcohol dehydrogenase
MRAAVSREVGQIAIEELDDPSPRSGEVKIKIQVAGICGSDLSIFKGKLKIPRPVVLGHEGTGTVVELGPDVKSLKVGDRVVCTIIGSCGHCFQCKRGEYALCENAPMFSGGMLDGTTRLTKGAEKIHQISYQGSFAEYSIVPEVCAIKVGEKTKLGDVVGLACGASTGLGAAMVRTPVEAGSTVVVYGAGGVGLSVMIGAKANGAAKIIAVDINPAKLENAKALGLATHTVLAGTEDTRAFVLAETGNRGADYAFDAVGLSSTTEEAMTVLRAGGEAVVIGHADGKIEATIDTVHFLRQKKLTGTFGGSIDPHVHIPRFIEMHETGKIDLSCLMDRQYALEELPQAFADLEAGRITRGCVVFG